MGKLAVKENSRRNARERTTAALLRVLMDPKYFLSTNAQRAEAAGVSEETLYLYLRDPDFREQHDRMLQDLLRKEIAAIFQAGISTAKQEGREGQADRKILYEMYGLYQRTINHEHTGAVKQEHTHKFDHDEYARQFNDFARRTGLGLAQSNGN